MKPTAKARVTGAALVAALSLLRFPSLAQTVASNQVLVFEQSSFPHPQSPGEWVLFGTHPPGNSAATAIPLDAGSFLRVSQPLLPGYFGSSARLVSEEYHWRPFLDGPVTGFAYRLRARVDLPDPVPGINPPPVTVTLSLLLGQGTRSFRSVSHTQIWRSGFLPENTWIEFPVLNLAGENFRAVDDSGARLNLGVTGEELRFGLEVSVSLPAATQATYVVDVDDVAVWAFRSEGLPPGMAFDPRDLYVAPDGEAFRVVSENEVSNLRFPLRRVGETSVPLSGRGRVQVWIDGEVDSEQAFLVRLGTGISETTFQPTGGGASLCPYRVEATLEQVGGGRIYAPARYTQLVIPTFESRDCFAGVLAFLTQNAACGGTPSRAVPPIVPAKGDSDLNTLRAFRDQVMAPTPAGRYFANLYNTHSPAAVTTLFRHPKLVLDLGQAWDSWVEGAAAMVAGNGASRNVSPAMLTDLTEILDAFESYGPPSLARAVANERARLAVHTWAGQSFAAIWQRVLSAGTAQPCVADGEGLCLNGGRYRVEADWKKPNGETGRAKAVALTSDSGYFWFFNPANVEILTKVLNGCPVNGRTWSFSAGLTNLEVELFVHDTQTGVGKRYVNPQRTDFAPILDTSAISCSGASSSEAAEIEPRPEPAVTPRLGSCGPGPQRLCLRSGRFAVEATWTRADGTSGPALVSPLTDDTGTFWFFRAENVELVVKILDACTVSGRPRFWVFAGGTTNVGVELLVHDTQTGTEKRYSRPAGRAFAPILDTDAFATCSP